MQSKKIYLKLNKQNIKYILSITLLLILIGITLKAQNMSLFLKATKSSWYTEFLMPVVDSVARKGTSLAILDIGTGPGTLPKLLIQRNENFRVTGIDIDSGMIREAKRRFTHKNVSFQYQKMNSPLLFDDDQFDVVTFCSVLFLLDDSIKANLVNEALRVLRPGGEIIILSPSGDKMVASSFAEVWRFNYSANNFTFPIWKMATTRRARQWRSDSWPAHYAQQHQLAYASGLTFNRNAIIEIITKAPLGQ